MSSGSAPRLATLAAPPLARDASQLPPGWNTARPRGTSFGDSSGSPEAGRARSSTFGGATDKVPPALLGNQGRPHSNSCGGASPCDALHIQLPPASAAYPKDTNGSGTFGVRRASASLANGGANGLGLALSGSPLAGIVQKVEEDQENDYCDIIGRTRLPSAPQAAPMPAMPSGGAWDQVLLHGSARELTQKLAELFRNDPPSDGGRFPNRCGMFHNYRGSYGMKVFSPSAVVKTLGLAQTWWADAPNILRLRLAPRMRLIIVGDTHGQLEDVLWIFFKYGVPSRTNQYVFVGDIVDRGGHALEILLLLFAFKRDALDSVHILRGNHEDLHTCSAYGFRAEIESKFGDQGAWVFHHATHHVMPLMPVAAVLTDPSKSRSVFVVHGGIPARCPECPPGPVLLKYIEAVNRKVPSVCGSQDILYNMLWADPVPAGSDRAANGGRGNAFTENETYEFCQANQFSCVVRAHQLPTTRAGYEILHQNRCWTVFSASNYTGNMGNHGGVLICDCTERNIFGESGPQPKEHWAPAWPALASILAEHDIATCSDKVRVEVSCRVEAGPPAPTMQERTQAEDQQLSQIQAYVVDQIIKRKEDIFQALADADDCTVGTIPWQVWASRMAAALPELEGQPDLWRRLSRQWGLDPRRPVAYVHFLHRFKVLSMLGAGSKSTHVDMLSAMSSLRVHISDVACQDLIASLTGNMSDAVSLVEFTEFLSNYGVPVPRWQSAAMYEALFAYLSRPPNQEDVLTALALISSAPEGHVANPGGTAWSDMARYLGEQIAKHGSKLAFFRRFDENGDGFIVTSELQKGLTEGLPELGMHFDDVQLQALARHMDCQGVENGRVSVIEFLRAVGPAKLAKALHGAMLGDMMRPLYFHRPALGAFLARLDPTQSSLVSLEQFHDGLLEMNRQLEGGQRGLTSYQIKAVGEVASGGSGSVHFRDFLQSLRAVDTERLRAVGQAGQMACSVALSGPRA